MGAIVQLKFVIDGLINTLRNQVGDGYFGMLTLLYSINSSVSRVDWC